jgi:hypothetical protein
VAGALVVDCVGCYQASFTMKIALFVISLSSARAFAPPMSFVPRARVVAKGYLDDLSGDLYGEVDNPDLEKTREATDAKETDRYGVQNWEGFVDFDEFDGGDGQMGVAGDGKKGLEKFGDDVAPRLAKSRTMSAKNAWGSSTGYSDTLREKGFDTARAQQLENWANQQELRRKRIDHTANLDSFNTQTADENWRELASFGIERTQDFDLDAEFGPVTPGDQLEGVIELHSRIGQPAVFEIPLKNEYMGFADFRAAFTNETPVEWTVEPASGSLSKDPVNFIVRFMPQNPGTLEGYLVIETEDFKKTWKVVGSTA